MTERTYLAIDLKSFYASVECMERSLDPMTTNLVVADASRTEKTICLAVSPSLKAYGIPGRARLFEVVQKVKEANLKRQRNAPGYRFTGASSSSVELANNPGLAIDYLIAPPRMAHYMEHSTRIYSVYLKHVAPDDIHVYSIDEVLIDATSYLKRENITAKDLAMRIILDVLRTTGITATAGIGPNLYLAKIAMDIYAKHVQPDENGVRIAELDEMKYRQLMWTHRPLTDFWRVGKGYEKKLESIGLYTMGDIARCSLGAPTDLYNEDTLYDLFGVNAELLIDHAWGWEPCTIADIKAYKPEASSVGSGQVLECPYDFARTRLVVREMADQLALSLVESRLVTRQIVLTVGYDIENLTDETRSKAYMNNELLCAGNTVAAIDELYLYLNNRTAIGYIRACMKRARKKESSLLLASQNVEDFLLPEAAELTKPLFSIPAYQFLFHPGTVDGGKYREALQLEECEYGVVRSCARGNCLFKCGDERYNLLVKTPPHKLRCYGTAGGR